MRKDWIRTEEERELRRLKNLTKQQRKFKKLTIIKTIVRVGAKRYISHR